MKFTLRYRNLNSEKTLAALIETRLLKLAEQLRIEDANILLERRPESSPPYRVEIHLAVPGPDLRAERIDNTPLQAFNWALEDIERRLRERALNRLSRSPARARRTATFGARASRFR